MLAPHYARIDGALRAHEEHVHFAARKHPDQFASAYLRLTRGLWGVPARHPHFVGRERELALFTERLDEAEGGAIQVRE